MYLFPLASLMLVFLTTVKTQDVDEDNFQEIICSEDEVIRAAVVECVALMPQEHFDIIKQCDPRAADAGDDKFKLLDIYCNEDEPNEEADKCVTEIYNAKGMDEMEHIAPVSECLEKLLSK